MRDIAKSASAGIGAISLAALLAGCNARPLQFPEAARSLGATLHGNSCPLGASDLAARTRETWRSAPRTNPYANEFRCVAIEDDLTRDAINDCAPDPDAVLAAPLEISRHITGELFYMGLFPREYAYDLRPLADGGTEVELRIQFRGARVSDPAAMADLRTKLALAADLWTSHSPRESKLRFRFVAVTDDTTSPHFVINLDAGAPRTPYDVTWGAAWSWHLMAHEAGHMMGLDDEYGQLRKTLGHILNMEPTWDADPSAKIDWYKCDLSSLMCDSKGKNSTPLRYHYYVILRRRFCRAKPADYPRF